MVQLSDYFGGLLGVDDARARRDSLERAIRRLPNELERNYSFIDTAAASRTPARRGMYPEIDASLGGLRPMEIRAMADRERQIGERAALLGRDIPSVMQLTPNEIRLAGLQGALDAAILDPLSGDFSAYSGLVKESPDDTVLSRAGKRTLGALGDVGEFISGNAGEVYRYAMSPADNPYEMRFQEFGERDVFEEAEEAERSGQLASKSYNVAQKVLKGATPEELPEDERVIAENLVKNAPASPARPNAAAQQVAAEAGLLSPPKQSKLGGLLSVMAQNLQDAMVAEGTLQANMPQLVTADDLDKLRTITPQMILAQSQKIKQGREERLAQDRRTAVSDLKNQLAIQRELKNLGAEDNKKLEREAESILKARETIGFIDEALPLISGFAATGSPASQLSQFVAGTPAFNLDAALRPIRARIGFDELTRMREMSPTGGALGQVSNFENQLLQATKGALEIGVDRETMRRNLLNYRDAQMAMIHGIVDNQGRLRRLESQGDLDALRAGRFRVATQADVGRLRSQSGGIMNYNRQTGAFE